MTFQLMTFLVSLFLLFMVSRCLLLAWQWSRASQTPQLYKLFIGALRIDLNNIAYIAILPALLIPWLENQAWFVTVCSFWFAVFFLLSAFLEICTPQFISEYDTRPNLMFVEYLKHPKEVSSMLLKGYKKVLVLALIALVAFVYLDYYLFFGWQPVTALAPWWLRIIETFLYAVIGFAFLRGTFKKRPINPSSVAFASDPLINSLTLNSIYSLSYAIYTTKNERSAQDVYGKMPAEQVNQLVCQVAHIEETVPSHSGIATMHHQVPTVSLSKPKNIVIILEESFGAQYSQLLTGNTTQGQNLTPCLDALYLKGWGFSQAYATGTRSVRGLEALSAGFPPTIAQSVFRLPNAQQGFFTLAQLLTPLGFHARFVYGGEAHFDNMRGFFLGNGFKEVYDENHFKDTQFKGVWGYCDEDMFTQLHDLLSKDHQKGQPTLTIAFSVSNHSPWEYPQGRFQPLGEIASVENTVRYADYTLGQFFEKAQQQPYWDDTIFLVVADHDARVFGSEKIPLKHFHIPALILGRDVPVCYDSQLMSQIDLPPTLLSLAGVDCVHPMIGQDLTRFSPQRAMMQYDNHYGYLNGDVLTILAPYLPETQFRVDSDRELHLIEQMDPDLVRLAKAHAIWPSMVYKTRQYCAV